MIRLLVFATLFSLCSPLCADEPATPQEISFDKQIKPLFQARCQGCHQPAKSSGAYDMTSFANMVKGGESTLSAVVPGKPQESYLLQVITPVDGKAEMPKGKAPLSPVEIKLVQDWITQGAKNDSPAEDKVKYSLQNPPKYARPPIVTALDYSPKDDLLAISGFSEVILYKSDGSELVGRLIGLAERIESVRFSPDGTLLAVTGGQPGRMGEVQVWEVATQKLKLSVPVTYDTIYGASWSPDGKYIAFGCADNTFRAIDAATGEQVLYQGSHSDWVFDTVFSTDGSHLMSVSRDRTAKLTEFGTQRFIDNITSITPGALKGGIASVARHPERDEILVGGADGTPKVYRIYRKTSRVIGDDANLIRKFPEMPGRIFSVAYSPDGTKIVAGSSLDGTGNVYIYGGAYDGNLPEDIKQILAKRVSQQNAAEKEKLEKYFNENVKLLSKIENIESTIYEVTFRPDGQVVAAAGGDGQIRLIDVATGTVIKSFVPVSLSQPSMMERQVAKFNQILQIELPVEKVRPQEEVVSLQVEPAEVRLFNEFSYNQLVVTGTTASGQKVDLTRFAEYKLAAEIAGMNASGLIVPRQNGQTALTVSFNDKSVQVPVNIVGMELQHHVDFVQDVQPVLSKLGCNQGTCHGAKDGKNGFKLSLRGYDPIYDIRALTDDLGSRRVNLASPDDSLMLLKATGAVPHVGGQLTRKGEKAYEIIRRWINDGAKLKLDVPRVTSIEILPINPVIQSIGSIQQMRVIASYSDGTQRDVTREAFLQSSNTDIAKVHDLAGTVSAIRRGETAILVRYEGAYAATTITVMGNRSGFQWQEPPANNEIDKLVAAKLQRMKILPSGLCTDDEFLRRVYLDLTGLPPTPAEVNAFLADTRETQVKRNEVIDKLIGSEAFVDYWSNKWSDLLLVNSKFLGREGAGLYHNWIRDQIQNNTPYDQFVREVITASGSNKENPPASYYKILRTPEDTMENTTHLFLGIRFNCNKCHDHPFERWTQDQYYETAAYFARLGLKQDPASGDQKIGGTAVEGAKPLYEIVFDQQSGEIKHDRTGQVTAPEFPFSCDYPKTEGASRRQELAQWMTSPDNPYFARSYVNRIWGYMLGVGLIEPLDDIRAGNPPTNPELLDWLTAEFIKSGFDVRHLMRTIAQSRTYQLSIKTNEWNVDDETNYSHALARRLPAEVLFDAIHEVTGSVPRIPGVPAGTHATQLPDGAIELPSGFLAQLGRPPRESACECERENNLQLGPVMALIGGPTVSSAISDPQNAIAKLVTTEPDNSKLVNDLFLRILNRPATERELKAGIEAIEMLDEEHQALVAELAEYEKQLAPILAQKEAKRQEKINAAQAAVKAYEDEIAPQEKQLDMQQQERIAKATAELQAYEQSLPQKQTEWETAQLSSPAWVALDPQKLASTFGANLTRQDDLSIFVEGPHGKGNYEVITQVTLPTITGLRIEALTDPRLPSNGPGRPQNGNFVLSELTVEYATLDKPTEFHKVEFATAKASFSQQGYDVKTAIDGQAPNSGNGWAISPETGKDHVAVFETKTDLKADAGIILKITMNQQYADSMHTLGKFRLSVTGAPKPLDLGTPRQLTEALKVAKDQRTPEQQAEISKYFREQDQQLKNLQAALATARQPRPVNPKLQALRDTLAEANQPLPPDLMLERLQRSVKLSQEQLGNKRLTAAQDIAWALINSPAFLFNR